MRNAGEPHQPNYHHRKNMSGYSSEDESRHETENENPDQFRRNRRGSDEKRNQAPVYRGDNMGPFISDDERRDNGFKQDKGNVQPRGKSQRPPPHTSEQLGRLEYFCDRSLQIAFSSITDPKEEPWMENGDDRNLGGGIRALDKISERESPEVFYNVTQNKITLKDMKKRRHR